MSHLGQSLRTSKYSPVPGAWQRFLAILSLVLCYAIHLGSTENINKRSPGAPASYYFCQNEKLYSKKVNGLLSKIFLYIFYRNLFLVFTARQKMFPLCNSKTLYVMFTDSRQESLEPKVRDEISFLLGGKKSIF
jgi:hypothetical protein